MLRIPSPAPAMEPFELVVEEGDAPPHKEVYFVPEQNTSQRTKILEYGLTDDLVALFPLRIGAGGDWVKRYATLKHIAFEGFNFVFSDTSDDIISLIESLPAIFIKNYHFGFGIRREYEAIASWLESMGFKELVISKTTSTTVGSDLCIINYDDLEEIRKKINRIYERTQEASRHCKEIAVHNAIGRFSNRPELQKKLNSRTNLLVNLLSKYTEAQAALSPQGQKSIIKKAKNATRRLAEKNSAELLSLKSEIEIVTLEQLIKKYEERLARPKQEEDSWQRFFSENPFILSLVFGSPVIKIKDSAYLGGQKLNGTGSKITDFLFANNSTANAALIEIKTPATKLLGSSPYRNDVYSPTTELTGGITQVLKQRLMLQKDFYRLKAQEKSFPETYYIKCILVAGTTPQTEKIESFELFRGSVHDVVIITFDELLGKLKIILEHLSQAKS